MGIGSDKVQTFIANRTQEITLANNYCSDLISEYGINDIDGSRTGAQVMADIQNVRNQFPTKPFFQTTLPPATNSTDSWATVANQTYNTASTNTQRINFNNLVRGVFSGLSGYFEVADLVESGRDSGYWQANGTAQSYTQDGLHESQGCINAIIANEAFATSTITRSSSTETTSPRPPQFVPRCNLPSASTKPRNRHRGFVVRSHKTCT
jgi:hypothetical protein